VGIDSTLPPKKTTRREPELIWQLKITLADSKPPIWRRIQVPGSISLYKLHVIIQIAMPWSNSHLYEFQVGEVDYGDPSPEVDYPLKSARRIKLSEAAPAPKAKISYTYDFGDNWEHAIVVEKILAPEPGVHYPVCLKGVRAAPPDDCGGIWGYADFVAAIQDPEHAEHDELLEWIGGKWDPEAFDLEGTNAELQQIK
jgi:hypothetical protein